MVKAMVAKFNGTCVKCGDPIVAGTPMLFAGSGKSSHVSCGPVGGQPPSRKLPWGLNQEELTKWYAKEEARLAALTDKMADYQASRSTNKPVQPSSEFKSGYRQADTRLVNQDYIIATCPSCTWESTVVPIRQVEGWDIAARYTRDHRSSHKH